MIKCVDVLGNCLLFLRVFGINFIFIKIVSWGLCKFLFSGLFFISS